MKFKVGQMVRTKDDRWFNKGELLKIVELDRSDKTYRCKGTGGTWWQNDSDLESSPQTLEDKLKLFKAGTHVLHTPTQEIYGKLMVELEKRGLALVGRHLKDAKKLWSALGKYTCVLYVSSGCHCGTRGYYVADGKEIIELTLEDFRMGNAHRVSDSEQEGHMKITIETDGHYKTTAECNGITAESFCNPTDEFKLSKGVHMAVQRLLEELEEPEESEEDTCFHVGNTVEVVGCHNEFLKDVVGKRGVVTRIDERACEKYEIKYEESISGNDKWWSHPEELKLISKEGTSFHMGDIVEVVDADGYKFFDKVKGIQGIIVSHYNKDVCEVKFPFVVSKKDTWAYYPPALKLIRRGNN